MAGADLTQVFLSTAFYLGMLRFMVPITLSALGEVVAEKSGIVNIGLEGMIMLGGLASVCTAWFTGNLWLALGAGMAVGVVVGLVHAFIAIYLKGDQIVDGVGINLFAYGIGVIVLYLTWGTFANSPYIPLSARVPTFYGVSPFMPFTLIMCVAVWYFLQKTTYGLRLRAAGEDPEVAEAAGINVNRIRLLATIFGAVLSCLAGAFLGIDWLASYARDLSAGKGFIALALVVFSKWNPLILIGGGLIFGFFLNLALSIPSGIVPDQLLYAVPYIATLVIVSGVVGRARAPKSSGKPYKKE
jgi:simple sugar transport system permease protein